MRLHYDQQSFASLSYIRHHIHSHVFTHLTISFQHTWGMVFFLSHFAGLLSLAHRTFEYERGEESDSESLSSRELNKKKSIDGREEKNQFL
jgi:hypothetical protein